MSQAQKTAQATKKGDQEQQGEGKDLRNEQLDDDVACCLALIDEALEDNEAVAEERKQREIDQARQELLDAEDSAERMILAEKYERLGFHVECICCDCGVYDPDGAYLGDV